MDGMGGNVAAFAGTVGACSAIHCESHFAVQNDVGGFDGVGVIGIAGVRHILPDVGLPEAFPF